MMRSDKDNPLHPTVSGLYCTVFEQLPRYRAHQRSHSAGYNELMADCALLSQGATGEELFNYGLEPRRAIFGQ